MNGFFNFMKRMPIPSTRSQTSTTDSVGSSSDSASRSQPTNQITEQDHEDDFLSWIRPNNSGHSNGGLNKLSHGRAGEIASRAPELWWSSLHKSLNNSPERYDHSPLRDPAIWLPHESVSIFEYHCHTNVSHELL